MEKRPINHMLGICPSCGCITKPGGASSSPVTTMGSEHCIKCGKTYTFVVTNSEDNMTISVCNREKEYENDRIQKLENCKQVIESVCNSFGVPLEEFVKG